MINWKHEEAPANVGAVDLGPIAGSDELLTADATLLWEMYNTSLMVSHELGAGGGAVAVSRQIEAYEGRKTEAGRIFAGFLGHVAVDLGALLPQYPFDTADSAVTIRTIDIYTSKTFNGYEHTDLTSPNCPMGLRYVTANRIPTIIPELPEYAAASVARMPLGRTPHSHPDMADVTRQWPRLVLAVDA